MEQFLDKLIPMKNDSDTNIDIAMLLLINTLPDPDKPYNIYKYSKYEGFYDFMNVLDDMIVIISFELLLDALEACGALVNDSIGYRNMMEDIYKEHGVSMIEESYEIFDTLRADIYKVIKSEYDIDHESEVVIRFLESAKHYTNINSVVARMYDIINKHYDKILQVPDEVLLNNNYADVMGIDLDKSIHNDFILEYLTSDIKDRRLFAFSYYEYIGRITITRDNGADINSFKGIKELFNKFIKGENINLSSELEVIE